MNLTPIFVVARKELTDGLRDRRALYSIFAVALFGPLLISFMLRQLAVEKKAAEEIRLPVAGREYAPLLVNWLEQQSGVEVAPGPADAEAAVREGKEDVVLVIKGEFAGDFGQSKPAPVEVFSDSTRKSAQPKLARVLSLLSGFNAQSATLRLIARGVSPEVVRPLAVRQLDVANAQQRGAAVLNAILMFLALAAMAAGMQIATDATAGERERGSLEPLLLNPVPRWQLVAGKWLASAAMSFGGMLVTAKVISIAVARLPLEDLGVRLNFGTPRMLLLIAVMGPLALLLPAIQTWTSCFAKSFKEAQSYTGLLVIPVAFLGVLTTMGPLANRSWILAIPLLSQYAMGADVLAGKGVAAAALLTAGIEAAAAAALFVWLAARLFAAERIIARP